MDLSNATFVDTSEDNGLIFRPKFSEEPVISGRTQKQSPSSPERQKITNIASWKNSKEAATPSSLSHYKGRLHTTSPEGKKSGGTSTFTELHSPSLHYK